MNDDRTTKQGTNQSRGRAATKRNRFFRGKPMRAAEFQAEQDYLIERRRLISRAVLGWGVVNGLTITGPRRPAPEGDANQPQDSAPESTFGPGAQAKAPETPTSPTTGSGSVSVGAGLALDAEGREIMVQQPATLSRRNTFLLMRPGSHGCTPRPIEGVAPGRYVLAAHYAELRTEDYVEPFTCFCDEPEKKFVCETTLFSLRPVGDGPCPCGDPGCRTCECGARSCGCDSGVRSTVCLCSWVEQPVLPHGSRLCEWQGYWVDPATWVDLACVTVNGGGDRCNPIDFGYIEDDCGPRRLVKNNDLLYDLIRGCDLTRVKKISWSRWHRNAAAMPWTEFLDFIGADPGDPDSDAPVTTKLTIDFTGPVLEGTVRADCFSLNFLVPSEDTGWLKVESAVLAEPRTAPPNVGDPPGTTRSVTLEVMPGWRHEVGERGGIVAMNGATVQLEVRGDYILDCHKQAIDANARGFALSDDDSGNLQPGNGTPGGTFVSVFRVQKRPEKAAYRS